MFRIKYINNEKGVALITSIMLLSLLTIIGFSALNSSDIELKIAGNERTVSQAFYFAEAGIEHARTKLWKDGVSFTNALIAQENGDILTNALASTLPGIAIFRVNSDNTPYVSLPGSYEAFLSNDNEPVATPPDATNTIDNNDVIIVTSFGVGPGNARAVVQAEIKKEPPFPPFPGSIVLPGPDVIFHGGNSNASGVDGTSSLAVVLSSSASESTVETNLSSIGRLDNYICDAGDGSTCIESQTLDDRFTKIADINSMVDTVIRSADTFIDAPGLETTLTEAQVGTTAVPKIVVVNGDAVLGPVDGTGILVVTGTLTLNGNFDYHGIILVVGEGKVERKGGGNGTITGSIYVANTNTPDEVEPSKVGIPYYDVSGGGNSDIVYDPSASDITANNFPLVMQNWRQL